jgi:predicted trehalose synthase
VSLDSAAVLALINIFGLMVVAAIGWVKSSADRRKAKEENEEKATTLAAKVINTSAALAQEAKTVASTLAIKVEEGAKAAGEAYKEANSVNLKIKDLNEQLKALHEKVDQLSSSKADKGKR